MKINQQTVRAEILSLRERERRPGYKYHKDPDYDVNFDIDNRGLVFTKSQKLSEKLNICIGYHNNCLCKKCQAIFDAEGISGC